MTAHSLPIASSRSMGISTGLVVLARSVGSREHGGRVAVAGQALVAVLDGAVGARPPGTREDDGRGGVGERLVLDRPRQRDERRLAQQLRAAISSIALTAA
jgi:hypothetical protein